METTQVEQILVVPTKAFHDVGMFQGFCDQPDAYLNALLDPANTSFQPRDEMESDPSFKQLIPYCIVRCINDGETLIYRYTRGKGQGESRLHSKSSVGIGGHISTLDVWGSSPHDESSGQQNVYRAGMMRELNEEIRLPENFSEKCVGLINDDSTDVGSVHLGVVHLIDVDVPDVSPREADILEASFEPVENLLADLEHFETWSQISLQALFSNA